MSELGAIVVRRLARERARRRLDAGDAWWTRESLASIPEGRKLLRLMVVRTSGLPRGMPGTGRVSRGNASPESQHLREVASRLGAYRETSLDRVWLANTLYERADEIDHRSPRNRPANNAARDLWITIDALKSGDSHKEIERRWKLTANAATIKKRTLSRAKSFISSWPEFTDADWRQILKLAVRRYRAKAK